MLLDIAPSRHELRFVRAEIAGARLKCAFGGCVDAVVAPPAVDNG